MSRWWWWWTGCICVVTRRVRTVGGVPCISSWLIYTISKLIIGGGRWRWYIFFFLSVYIYILEGGRCWWWWTGCIYIVTRRRRRVGGVPHNSSWVIYAISKLIIGGGKWRWCIFLFLSAHIYMLEGGGGGWWWWWTGCIYVVTRRVRRVGGVPHISSCLIYTISKLIIGVGRWRWYIFLFVSVYIYIGGGKGVGDGGGGGGVYILSRGGEGE